MKNSQHNLFSPSGCLTPEAFTLLGEDKLTAQERQLALDHLRSCELCSLALEGLANIDLNQVNSDLEEVKRNLKVIRPLDFMHEKRGLRFRLRIRIISILIVVLLAAGIYYLSTNRSHIENRPATVIEEVDLPFKLEYKDTSDARLHYKTSNKKAKWDEKVKRQRQQRQQPVTTN